MLTNQQYILNKMSLKINANELGNINIWKGIYGLIWNMGPGNKPDILMRPMRQCVPGKNS